MKAPPNIRRHLLWEYQWDTVDFDQLSIVVIERIIERGTMEEWKEMLRYYGKEWILDIAEKSTRLDEKNKQFTPLFLESEFILD
ncbi:MAG: hypothetical protein H6557_23175 [Lewinellaceae bacterium]|nr:hypothetical protein [Phaeodactylibacter sp.]MCB9039530.1 hypothetical protein [Lewinellaceae bacterium]